MSNAISFSVPESKIELMYAIDKMVAETGENRSSLIVQLLQEALDNRKKIDDVLNRIESKTDRILELLAR